MGVLWQLVVSRRYGRSKCAPEKERERLDEETPASQGKIHVDFSTWNAMWSCFVAEVWFLFLFAIEGCRPAQVPRSCGRGGYARGVRWL